MKKNIHRLMIIPIKILEFFVKQDDNYITFYSQFDTHVNVIKEIDKKKYKCIVLTPKISNFHLQLYYLVRSKYLFFDNVYTPLYNVNTLEKKVIQLWHAPGAIKKFGLNRINVKEGNSNKLQYYKSVYKKIDYITVGSHHMFEVCQRSMGLEENKILKLGYPKIYDFYKNEYNVKSEGLKCNFDVEKINVLYIPTFRENQKDNEKQIELIEFLLKELSEDFVLHYKLHNNVKMDFKASNLISSKHLIYTYKYFDYVITDYSSIVFEAAMFNPTFIFYNYDFEKYTKNQGLYFKEDELPGFISKMKEDVLEIILENKVHESYDFYKEYNNYYESGNMKKFIDIVLK